VRECLYYWLVEPMQESFLDESTSSPSVDIPIETSTGLVHFALFLDATGRPAYGRVRFHCGDEDQIPKQRLPLLQSLKEHFLSVLRLEYSEDAYLFPHPFWAFIRLGDHHSIGLGIQRFEPAPALDSVAFRNLFSASFKHREEIRLLIDGADKRIPLQYRYLSLYRLLELYLRTGRQWDQSELESSLQPHADRLRQAGFSRMPVKALHEMRDSCAHIRTGQEFGVTHLNLDQAARVEKFLPILIDVCVSLLNSRFGPSLRVGVGRKPDAIQGT